MEYDVDGQEAPQWEWCAAHTDDITSVGMVLNKMWEWCSDSQNLCGSSVQYGLTTALLWQYCSLLTDSPSLGSGVQYNLTPSKELAQYNHTKEYKGISTMDNAI